MVSCCCLLSVFVRLVCVVCAFVLQYYYAFVLSLQNVTVRAASSEQVNVLEHSGFLGTGGQCASESEYLDPRS